MEWNTSSGIEEAARGVPAPRKGSVYMNSWNPCGLMLQGPPMT